MVLENILQKLVDNLGKVIPGNVQLVLNGTAFTVQALVQKLGQLLALYAAVDEAKQQHLVAVKQLHAAVPDARQLVAALGSVLRGQLGSGNPLLAQLGLKTGARSKPSALKKAQAAASGLATKKARHNSGKKSRLALSEPVQVDVVLVGPDGKPIQQSGSAPNGNGSGGAGQPEKG